jgi:tRNA-binding EMAP/Myf-like protein
MGIESKGMVLAVETQDGRLNVLTANENVRNGTRVK